MIFRCYNYILKLEETCLGGPGVSLRHADWQDISLSAVELLGQPLRFG